MSSLTVVTTVLTAPAAHAAGPGCGDTIVANTTLTSNVGPCPNDGIKIGADGITLDLHGYTISGTPMPGDGAGVLVAGHTGVTVKNGTVTSFDGGVVIENGGGNVVEHIIAKKNIGLSQGHDPNLPGTPFGDGIAIEGSSNNRIVNNVAIKNGPFDGIGLFEVPDTDHPFTQSPTTGNLIKGNQALLNVACRRDGFCDNDGIRVEPHVSPGNRIIGNLVARNSLDGISIFGFVSGTYVSQNTVKKNGFSGAVPGDGIRVFGFSNTIQSNIAIGNAQDGISVGRRSIAPPGSFPPPNGRDNTIKFNTSTNNVAHDLYDGNPGCDNNHWIKNIFKTRFPVDCVN